MLSPPPGPANPGPVIIDLTDDSDDISVCEIQPSSSANIVIKQEPGEEKTKVIDVEAAPVEIDSTSVEPSIEQMDTTSVEVAPELHPSTVAEPSVEQVDADAGHAAIEHTGPESVQVDNEQADTASVVNHEVQTETTPMHIPNEPSDTAATVVTEKDPDTMSPKHYNDQAETSEHSGDNHIDDELQDDALFVPETNEDDSNTNLGPAEVEQIDVNFVGTIQGSPDEHIEGQNDTTSVGDQDPFNINDANDTIEDMNFEPLPELGPFPNMDIDLDGFDALRQYNENTADLGEDGVLDDVPNGTHDAGEDFVSNGYRTRDTSPEPLGTVVDDNGDVMDWNTLLEEDAAATHEITAAAFAKRKKEYERKKEKGTNNQEDDIRFAAEQAEELRRIRDLERSQMEVEEPAERPGLPPGYEEEELLFVPEVPARPQPKKKAAPKPRNRLSKKDVDEAISAGISAGFGESRKPKRKARASSEDRQPRKRRETKKGGGVKKPANKRGRKQGPNMSNIASLGQTNIVAAAQANALRPDMPTFTSTTKAKALQELIASIPSSERASVRSDRTAIMEATKKFKGRGAVRADGHGGWILKGMESSLYNHQLLGAAFLRERETGDSKPKGGLVCDEMGFGKTIQMIANMIDGKAEPGSHIKTTLIVAPPSLLNQWMQELDKHVKGNALGRILRFHSGSRLHTNNILGDLMEYDVILTTYNEIRRSYPLCEPPKHLASEERKNEWWKNYYHEKVGPLHRLKFHRIVLDEAHYIKNHASKTSIAVRALTGNFKWCITGTPLLNYLEELFPYFSFLKVPHTGDFNTFLHNYCSNRKHSREPVHMGRVHNILRAIMLRRTHVDTLFNAPIVKLPGITHNTVLIEFNHVERNIYNLIKSRFVQQINGYAKAEGGLAANVHHVLSMLLRLRMLCTHLMLIQTVLKQMLNAADVETLWRLTEKEVHPSDDAAQMNMIRSLRRMLAKNENTITTAQTKTVEPTLAMTTEMQDEEDTGSNYGLYFKFRKFLRMLSTSGTWTELHLRSICSKCRLPPDDPVCTSCYHVYCKECVVALHRERRERGEERTACLECQTTFEETTPCSGLAELGFGSAEVMPKVAKKRAQIKRQQERAKKAAIGRRGTSARRASTDSDEEDEEGEDIDWIEHGGAMLPSAKLAATKAAILNWRAKDKDQKIIVYTQFLDCGRILSKVCEQEGWGHINYNGKMTIEQRDKAINRFAKDPDIFIMICSLKAGGVGLNLTMASKVIILDLWFNSAVEAQAYCRAFRIGQEQRVDVLRFVVKDSIDEDLIKMQERKELEVTGAIGPDSMGKRATIQQLLELFGEVKEEGENEFILVEDEGDSDYDEDIDPATRLPPRPF
ncbi:hypothetical protein H2200_003100 [Cladophialophora chaetospira]|uniref:Uncharacterized protein n=1 Tax=Cladophialophora chaetospira TaxID=386627 RepID=A0AA39CL54_9EURO|nr:hypothetical protein H2200_003100 [Cladophialophora chaetospira]